jgi:DNA-binding NtrC family response regulator
MFACPRARRYSEPQRDWKMAAGKDVMVLDDEPIVGDRLKPALEKEGFAVEVFTDSGAALERLKQKSFAVLVTDVKMRGPTGMDVLRFVKEQSPSTQVIVITGYATIETSHEAGALGAVEFLAKPFKIKDIVKMVAKSSRAG